MIIALDYDDTFTADPEGWSLFVEMMKQRGHSISFVTFRMEPDNNIHTDSLDILGDAERLKIPVVFTNHRQKRHVFKADVWIDDSPHMIASYPAMTSMLWGCERSNDTEIDPDVA
jgi:hypothetical protein